MIFFKNNFLLVFHRYLNKKAQVPTFAPGQLVLLAFASNLLSILCYLATVDESRAFIGAVLECGPAPCVSSL